MSRLRNKIHSSDSDEQVSIFDSEQDRPTPLTQHTANHDRNAKNRDKDDKKSRKSSDKNREKKLNKDEQSIMKTLLGEENKQKRKDLPKEKPTQLNHRHSNSTSQPAPIQEQPIIPPVKHVKNNLDVDEMKLEDAELTWLDLQQTTFEKPSELASYNKRNPRRQPPTFNMQYQSRSRQQYGYQPDYNSHSYGYGYHPRGYGRGEAYKMPNFNGYLMQNRANQYDEYQGSRDYNSDDKYHSYQNHIIPEMQQASNGYSEGLSNQDLYEGIVGYNATLEKEEPANQPRAQMMEEQKQTKELTKEQSKLRRIQILEEIESLREQLIKLEEQAKDENEGKSEIKQGIEMCEEGTTGRSPLWKFEPLPALIKYTPVSKQQSEKCQKSKTERRIAMIQLILKQNPFLTLSEMTEVLKALDPFLNSRIQRSVVLRLLKLIGYKKKKITLSKDRNTPLNLELRMKFALRYKAWVAQQYDISYYDQLIINEYFNKQSGWCKQTEEIEVRPQKFMSRSVVVIAILAKDGSCLWQARCGQTPDLQYGKVLSKMLKAAGQGKQKRMLVANPQSYRRPDHFQEIAARRDWQVSVLPKQSLYLNPFQFYFAEVKDKLRQKKFQSLQSLFAETTSALHECGKDKTGVRAVSKIDIFIEKAIQKENF